MWACSTLCRGYTHTFNSYCYLSADRSFNNGLIYCSFKCRRERLPRPKFPFVLINGLWDLLGGPFAYGLTPKDTAKIRSG
ncbi:uncharacterized [Tachysurus ichikawai]